MPTLEGYLYLESQEDPDRPGTFLLPPRWKFTEGGPPVMEYEQGTKPVEQILAEIQAMDWKLIRTAADPDHPGWYRYWLQREIA